MDLVVAIRLRVFVYVVTSHPYTSNSASFGFDMIDHHCITLRTLCNG